MAQSFAVFADGSIRWSCLHCGQEVAVGADGAGRQGLCPGCGRLIPTPELVPIVPVPRRLTDEELFQVQLRILLRFAALVVRGFACIAGVVVLVLLLWWLAGLR